MEVRIPGVKMQMGGREWIVPPVAIGPLKRLSAKFGLADGSFPARDPDLVIQMLTAALMRNYPDITEQIVEDELLDVANFDEVMQAVMGAGGLREKGGEPGEAMAPGRSTGTGSTPT